jgi:hypothetical protein
MLFISISQSESEYYQYHYNYADTFVFAFSRVFLFQQTYLVFALFLSPDVFSSKYLHFNCHNYGFFFARCSAHDNQRQILRISWLTICSPRTVFSRSFPYWILTQIECHIDGKNRTHRRMYGTFAQGVSNSWNGVAADKSYTETISFTNNRRIHGKDSIVSGPACCGKTPNLGVDT